MKYTVTSSFHFDFICTLYVLQIGIVLTDGQSRSIGKTMYEAFKSKQKKISLFAIGIGSNINERELKGIASNPSGEYMFKVDGYTALDAIKNSLAVRTCKGMYWLLNFHKPMSNCSNHERVWLHVHCSMFTHTNILLVLLFIH